MIYRYRNEEDGKTLRRYWTTACQACALKAQCTPGKERRISRWEHEAVLETVQDRLDRNPDKMRVRRQTVEHPFGTIKAWMGATHFQMRTLPKVATEMALHVLAYNMKRVMRILGIGELMAAMRLRRILAWPNKPRADDLRTSSDARGFAAPIRQILAGLAAHAIGAPIARVLTQPGPFAEVRLRVLALMEQGGAARARFIQWPPVM